MLYPTLFLHKDKNNYKHIELAPFHSQKSLQRMASPSSYFLFLLLLYSILSISSSPIPISLFNTIPHSDSFQSLGHVVSTSLARAHVIKNPKNAPIPATALFPYSGAYSISLGFGTPPQYMPLAMDTGSSFSWFPCTKKYLFKNCSGTSASISSFIPRHSSSARILGCLNPKCSWVHGSFDPNSTCHDCLSEKGNCRQICPPYMIRYGLGSTTGVAMVETLNLPHKKVSNFLVGCSVFSSNQPDGIAGFGRGIASIPSQLGLKKFSYCMVSHKFDNTRKGSFLLMDSDSDSGKKTEHFSYTRFLKNPDMPGNRPLADYYYVGLRRITVGGQKVKVPYKELNLDSSGNGGTIVDSGSTFTFMNRAVFTAVADAFLKHVKEYRRAGNVEALTGLRPCFEITRHEDGVRMPEVVLHFKGGADMALPLENYFVGVGDGKTSAVCLSMVTNDTVPENVGGPSVILGNLLMQNFHVEFDLRNERFGFRHQSCS